MAERTRKEEEDPSTPQQEWTLQIRPFSTIGRFEIPNFSLSVNPKISVKELLVRVAERDGMSLEFFAAVLSAPSLANRLDLNFIVEAVFSNKDTVYVMPKMTAVYEFSVEDYILTLFPRKGAMEVALDTNILVCFKTLPELQPIQSCYGEINFAALPENFLQVRKVGVSDAIVEGTVS
jgi:hypothetical protein